MPVSAGAVVVAGGTGALGGALVARLAAQGRRVAVPFRSAARFEAARAGLGDRVWGAEADIATPAGAAAFFDQAAHAMGAIDGLAVVSGAYAGSGALAGAPEDEWASMMRANLDPVYALCRAAVPHLATGDPCVVTVASRLVESGGSGAAAYVVAKAGVAALTRVLAIEYRGRIRFNCVAPGTIDTPDNRRAMPEADRSAWTPPESIAGVIAFLLSPESFPVTGAYIPVDARRAP
jgi:NAD(P)-dependent dehydrogenase (short-subunit alcohol dehydrogenase family)